MKIPSPRHEVVAKPLPAAEPAKPKEGAHALVTLKDLAFAAALPVLYPIAWLTPVGMQRRLAASIAKAAATIAPARAQAERRRFTSSFADQDPATLYEDVRALAYHETLNLLSVGSPLRAKARGSLFGGEHLEHALSLQKGVILWVAPTTYGPMMTKVALAQAGFQVWHLSRPSHGFSNSRFGRAFLNPIRVRAEGRCLAGRIVIRNGNVRAALTQLTERLLQNSVVSITIGTEGKALMTTPFLSGAMSVPPRPIQLARQNGASLLPVVTVGRRDGSFITVVGEALIAPDVNRSDVEVVQKLAQFLTPLARSFPAQFAKSAVFSPPASIGG